jgi:hypothetical protein
VEEKHRINGQSTTQILRKPSNSNGSMLLEQHVWFAIDQHVRFREVDDKFSAWIARFAIPRNSQFDVNKKNTAIL